MVDKNPRDFIHLEFFNTSDFTAYQVNAPQVPLIYFFATPTSGAHITQLAKFLSKNPQLHGMLPANSDNYVADLQRDWRALPVHVNSHCAYENWTLTGFE